VATAATLNGAKARPTLAKGPAPLLAAVPRPLPTPAAKLFDVGVSTVTETALLLLFLKVSAVLLSKVSPGVTHKVLSQLVWILIIQGSSRLQGVCGQVGRTKQVLNPNWYAALAKPSWTPPSWAFPLAWIPLKLLQTFAASLAWAALDRRVLATPIILFVLHLALGDVWNSQFFLKQRPLTGLFVIATFWGVLLAATFSLYSASPTAAYLVAPTCVWVLVAASLNLDVWYLNKDR